MILNMVATVELEKIAPSKKYLTPSIIYRADVHCEPNKDHKFYFGVAQTPFKERFQSHNRDFNHEQYIKRRAIQIHLVAKRCRNTIHNQLVNSCKSKR